MICFKFFLSLVLVAFMPLGVGCGSDPEAAAVPRATRTPERTPVPTRDLETLFQAEEKRRRAKAQWLESLRRTSEKNKKQGEEK